MREMTQPDLRAERELALRLFPSGHPYRENGLGTPASARRVDSRRLRRFHRERYLTRAARIIATTSTPMPRLERLLDGALTDALGGPEPPAPELPRLRSPAARTYALTVPGSREVEIRLGGLSVARSDPAYTATVLANEILGGRGLISRLFQDLREVHGLVYHAGSELESMSWGGSWAVEAGTDPHRVPRVLRRLGALTADLLERPPPEEELDRIRESLIGSLRLEADSTGGAHELAIEVAYHDLPLDFYLQWPSELRALRAEEVRAGAERGLDPRSAITVVAGPGR